MPTPNGIDRAPGWLRMLLAVPLWATALLAVGFLSLVAGTILGLSLGDLNAKIDFCDDDTSARFIQDAASRAASCE